MFRLNSIGPAFLALLIAAGSDAQEVAKPQAVRPQAVRPQAPTDTSSSTLPPLALARLGTQSLRHSDSIIAVAYSSDGAWLATAGRDHAVCLWNCVTGRLVHRVHDDEVDFHTVTFAPDSKRVILTGNSPTRPDGNFLLGIDVITGQEIYRIIGHEQPVSALWFMPGAQDCLSISVDLLLQWNVANGQTVGQRLQEWPSGIMATAPDAAVLAFASNKKEDPLIRLSNPLTGKTLLTIEGEWQTIHDPKGSACTQSKLVKQEQAIVALAVSAGGKLVASGSPFEPIRLWDGTTGQLVRTFEDPQGGIALALSPDSKWLASGTINGVVRVWNVATGKEVRSFPGFKAWVNALAFSPDSKTLAVAGAESRTLYLWDVVTGKDLRPGPGHRAAVQAVSFGADGRRLISVGSGKNDHRQLIAVWDGATGKQLQKFGPCDSRVLACAFSADGRKLALTEDHEVTPRLIQFPDGTTFDRFEIPTDLPSTEGHDPDLRFLALALSPDGRLLAGGSSDGKLFLWDTGDGKCLRWWKGHTALITSVAFSPDGKRLMSTSEDHAVRLWDTVNAGQVLQFDQGDDTCGGVCFSPDGKLAAALSAWCDGRLYLWDLETRKELQRVARGNKKVNQIAFSPNSKMLALSDVAGNIRLVEIATGKTRVSFRGHAGEITALAFAPDGLRLATGGADTTVLIWDATGSQPAPLAAPLSDIHLAKLWQDLGDEDAAVAYRAVGQLSAHPEQAEPFLTARLKQPPTPNAEQITQMIRQMGFSDYARRTAAMKNLRNLGLAAKPALQQALTWTYSPEIQQRAHLLLDQLERAELSGEQVRIERAQEALGWIGIRNPSIELHAERRDSDAQAASDD